LIGTAVAEELDVFTFLSLFVQFCSSYSPTAVYPYKDGRFQRRCFTPRSDLSHVFLLLCTVFPAWLIYSAMKMEQQILAMLLPPY
jgi:hypothetical protein